MSEDAQNNTCHTQDNQQGTHAKTATATDTALRHIRQTAFLMSAPTFKLCPADTGVEIAFAGRSNAGKSSAINTITNQRQLARSSKTPGRTQMINFFAVGDDAHRLVDLPGYGYAAVPLAMKIKWQKELERYLVARQSLQGLILLSDIRHPLQYFDEQMLLWAKDGGLPVHILLTKADKLKRGAGKNVLLQTKQTLAKQNLPFSVQLFSSLNKIGIDELLDVMATWLGLADSPVPTQACSNPSVQNSVAQDTALSKTALLSPGVESTDVQNADVQRLVVPNQPAMTAVGGTDVSDIDVSGTDVTGTNANSTRVDSTHNSTATDNACKNNAHKDNVHNDNVYNNDNAYNDNTNGDNRND